MGNAYFCESFLGQFQILRRRQFIGNFTDDYFKKLPIDPESNDDQRTKSLLCIKLLKSKLEEEEVAASPPGSLYDTNYKRWYRFGQGIYSMQDAADLPEAEQTVRMLVATRPKEHVKAISPTLCHPTCWPNTLSKSESTKRRRRSNGRFWHGWMNTSSW